MAQLTKQDIINKINQLFADNADGLITAAHLREVVTDVVDSYFDSSSNIEASNSLKLETLTAQEVADLAVNIIKANVTTQLDTLEKIETKINSGTIEAGTLEGNGAAEVAEIAINEIKNSVSTSFDNLFKVESYINSSGKIILNHEFDSSLPETLYSGNFEVEYDESNQQVKLSFTNPTRAAVFAHCIRSTSVSRFSEVFDGVSNPEMYISPTGTTNGNYGFGGVESARLYLRIALEDFDDEVEIELFKQFSTIRAIVKKIA